MPYPEGNSEQIPDLLALDNLLLRVLCCTCNLVERLLAIVTYKCRIIQAESLRVMQERYSTAIEG
jgi:hypothetical protein